MPEAEFLSDFIGEIYDAALEPVLWPAILRKTAQFIGGPSASLVAKDATSKTGLILHFDGGLDQRYVDLYFEKYVKLDPSTTGHYFAEIEEPIGTADIVPYDEFLQTRFYNEWAKPQGLVDFVTVVLDKTLTGVAMLGVFRHERDGVIDDEARRRMRLIAPHVRRSVLIGRVLESKTATADALTDTLNGLAAGMFLVDATGRIVHANLAGHGMLAAADLLSSNSGRLAAHDPEADRALRDLIVQAGQGDDALGNRGIAMPLRSVSGERHVVHVLPLTYGLRGKAGKACAASAALFVHKAAMEAPSAPEVIAKTYGLTPTELRVLLAIVQVGGVPEVSEALGVAESTVKTHLGRLYEKTGANRQADLVKLVAGFTNPLIG